jgi:hypothetical protein
MPGASYVFAEVQMKLGEILSNYLACHEYGVSAGHAEQLRYSIVVWEHWAGRALSVEDFTDEGLNRFLDWYRSCRKPDTVRTRRGNLLILWHWAYQEGLTDVAPRRIRKLRPIARTPTAWTVPEVRALIETAESLPGCFYGTRWRRAAWWSSLVRAGYDTSLRLADLLSLPSSTVRGQMLLVQHKTGRVVAVQLRPATLAAIDQTLADEPRELVWPLWGLRQTFYGHFRSLVSEAGIRPGTFRWLRKTAVTQLERIAPGQGTRLAGHTHRGTTEAWYIDQAQMDPAPLPPL